MAGKIRHQTEFAPDESGQAWRSSDTLAALPPESQVMAKAKDADIIEIWTQPEAGHDQLIYLTEKGLVVAEVPGGRVAKAAANLNRGRALPDDTEILEIPLKQFVRF